MTSRIFRDGKTQLGDPRHPSHHLTPISSRRESTSGSIRTRTHHVAAADELGRSIADKQFLAVGSGYRQIVDFLHDLGIVQAVGVEGTGSYGAELVRTLASVGMRVVDVARADRFDRRLRGKSDPIDARQAALSVLVGRGLATPKQRDGLAEFIRMLLAERTAAAKARTATIDSIHAQLVTAPEAVRADFRRYEGEKLLGVVARTRPARGVTPDHVCRLCLKRLAHRAQELARKIDDIDADLAHLTRQSNPALMSAHGVGPVVAGTLLAARGDNPDCVGTKAQFAALCGVAPIPASSGVRHRHRLSRGGDRQANATLHRIVLGRRRRKDPARWRTLISAALRACLIATSSAASSDTLTTKSSPCSPTQRSALPRGHCYASNV